MRAAAQAPVRIHEFAQHAGRLQTREDREIDRTFRMAAPGQHAARLRPQREHMAGTHDVAGFGVIGNRGADRGQPVHRRYARRHALACFDRYRERGAVFAAVVGDHRR